jgi:aryl-alcohol dehydrogenase-like predicted oxidoreductase
MRLAIEGRPEKSLAIRTIHAALDAGMRLIDTADCYCLDSEKEHHYGEELVREAIASWSGDKDSVKVATKGGKRKPPSGPWPTKGDPEYLKRTCEESLKALGVEAIWLYQLHAPDPGVPFAESVGALAELQREGKVVNVGLSNVSVEQLTEALGIVQVTSVQNEFSLLNPADKAVLDMCGMFGIAYLAYRPLGGSSAKEIGVKLPVLREVGAQVGASPQRVALAWLLAFSPVLIPIPSATKPTTAQDSAAAADLVLPAEALAAIASAAGIPS